METAVSTTRFSMVPASDSHQFETEFAQAKVRLAVAGLVALYMLFVLLGGWLPASLTLPFLSYIAIFFFLSLSLAYVIGKRPAIDHRRRAMAMALDYSSITLVIATGGAMMAPVFATLLWITVGYGIRYGSNYLGAGTVLALVSIAATTAFSPYWSEQPFIMAMIAITAIMVPAYAYILLNSIREAHDSAMAANVAKSKFLAQASHDLRQPVHAISLFTACLRDSGLSPDQRQMVDNIDRSLNSVTRLFRSLLDISTLDSGKVRPKLAIVAIDEIVSDLIDQNAEIARQSNVELRHVRTSLCVRTDPALLATILQNVISNAIKYAPGKPVLIGCRRRPGSASVAVYDRGPGIADDERARVFEEFYRGSSFRQTVDGIGLGLAILKRMAQLLSLDVRLRSQLGRGTSVEIAGFVPTAERPASVRFNASQPTTALRGLRVLLVEDDRDVQLATHTLLARWGCVVESASAAPERPQPCDLILADYDLHDSTGAECIALVRAALDRAVPAIVMTGHDPARVAEDLADGDVSILAKPIQPARLRAALMSHRFRRVQPHSPVD